MLPRRCPGRWRGRGRSRRRRPTGRRRRGRSARRSARGRPSGTPGPSSSHGEHDLAVVARRGRSVDRRRRVADGVVGEVADERGRAGRGSPTTRPAPTPLRSTRTRSSARSRRATRSTTSSRSTGSRRGSPASPSSARATSSRSSARRWRPIVSSSTLACVASRSARSGWARSTSSSVRMRVSGLRSSCDASATKRCCRWAASSTRSSMSFIVRARRAISSSPGGTGTRRCRSRPPIAATSARIASTGRSVRPTSHQSTTARASDARAGSRRGATAESVAMLSSMSSVGAPTMTTERRSPGRRARGRRPSSCGRPSTVRDRRVGCGRRPPARRRRRWRSTRAPRRPSRRRPARTASSSPSAVSTGGTSSPWRGDLARPAARATRRGPR